MSKTAIKTKRGEKKMKDKNNPELTKGSELFGYRVKRIVALPEIASVFYELEHVATGAQHIHISNRDKENAFSVLFKTVPSDSTGVAHILEHTALCGSESYPVRDPFFSMMKRSLSTFMNAFTASDWTSYPFATQNTKDFYNLLGVYLDAAFFPRLEELNFRQEGWRYEIEKDPDTGAEELVYKGIVFNEMKGAMSSPLNVMYRSLMTALYPDPTYGHNSGGDPEDIPSLTYEQFKEFHRRHYHPSNAFFFTYGNLPLAGHLKVISEKIMGRFTKIDPHTEVPNQPRWDQPKKTTYRYPTNENPKKKNQACVAWLTADVKDVFEVLTLKVLEQILLGNDAAPLRRALIESNLGSTLSDASGYNCENRDTMFAAGLKDVNAAAAPEIEKIIFSTLENLAADGIDPELVESAIHQIEFQAKEIVNEPYPYGLKLFLDSAGCWIHGGDPLHALNVKTAFEKLRDLIGNGAYLEKKIKEYFIDNGHRVLFTLKADTTMQAGLEQEEKKRLAAIKANLGSVEIEKIKATATALEKLQESKESLDILPTLERTDIPPTVISVKAAIETGRVSLYRQPTAGIEYFTAAAGLGRLPEKLLPLVPFFCFAYPLMGTKRRDYAALMREIDRYTGDISLSPHVHTKYGGTRTTLPFVSFSGKCLSRNKEKMLALIEELINETVFDNLKHLANTLNRFKASKESRIIQNGHRLAMSLASRNFSKTNFLKESWDGIHQFEFLKGLSLNLGHEKLQVIARDLEAIKKTVLKPANLKMAFVNENPDKRLLDFLAGRGTDKADNFRSPKITSTDTIVREGWSTAPAVSFVAQAFEAVKYGHKDAPALAVIAELMCNEYLHRELREKGGAYGGFANYNPENGIFAYASYRDPHIINTLGVYNRADDFIRSGNYTDENVKEAILMVCAELDKPDPPGPASELAFYRELILATDDMRQSFKAGLIRLRRDDIVRVAKKYFDSPDKTTAVISNEDKLNEANKRLKNPLRLHKI